jgi:multidrug efflux system outer membrane protein
MSLRLAAMAALVTLTGGCASMSPPAEPETHERQVAPVQNAGNAQDGHVTQWPDAMWWRAYSDETLNSLVDQALRDSPGLASAAARFGTASENARVAGATAGLKVDANAAFERYRLSDNGVLPPEFLGFNWVNQADLGINASYTFDWWGRNRALIESATDHARASEAEQQVVALALASTIAQTYFGWQADGARIALLDQHLDALQVAARLAQHRVDAGLDHTDDAERIRREQAAVREQQALLRGMRQLRVVELAALLGVAPDQLSPQLQLRALPAAHAGLPANASIDLMARRPDIAASRWRVEAARQDISSIRAEYYPDVTLHALAAVSSIEVGTLLEPGSWAPNMGVAVHLPIFDAGLRNARHGAAEAQLSDAVARYNETVVGAAREVGAAATALEQSTAQRQQRDRQVESATALLRSAGARQRAGVTDLRPELDARLALLREQDASLQVEYATLVADIQLQAALGGGLTTTESSP